MANVTKDDESGIGVGNDTGILETDKSDEKTDACNSEMSCSVSDKENYSASEYNAADDEILFVCDSLRRLREL